MKPDKKKKLEKELDKLVQEQGMEGNPPCEACGEPASCMHHWVHKSQSRYLRWKAKNLVPICMSCHYKLHNLADSKPYGQILRKKGLDWDSDLQEERKKTMNRTLANLEEVIKELNT